MSRAIELIGGPRDGDVIDAKDAHRQGIRADLGHTIRVPNCILGGLNNYMVSEVSDTHAFAYHVER